VFGLVRFSVFLNFVFDFTSQDIDKLLPVHLHLTVGHGEEPHLLLVSDRNDVHVAANLTIRKSAKIDYFFISEIPSFRGERDIGEHQVDSVVELVKQLLV